MDEFYKIFLNNKYKWTNTITENVKCQIFKTWPSLVNMVLLQFFNLQEQKYLIELKNKYDLHKSNDGIFAYKQNILRSRRIDLGFLMTLCFSKSMSLYFFVVHHEIKCEHILTVTFVNSYT